ncbi:MAG: polysaccharide deacetylase family protein [Elusimicrobiota bacterium]|jgi:peptidoglycan/xylan/chitin deacetylase (PgdA/CDA1 family)|nr:polysaccharide deacetylase family protein [Elusimicrobiota bacterium]
MQRVKNALIFVSIFIFFTMSAYSFEKKDFYTNGAAKSRKVALTFDDGPGVSTPAILDILKEKGVKATFFLLGSRVKANPQYTKRIAQEGHEIANHTYHHINFFSYNEPDKNDKFESELLLSEKIIKEITGIKTTLVRFPHGYLKPPAIQIAKKHGYTIVNWSFGCDWRKDISSDEILSKYKKEIKSGTIYLLHDAPKNAKSLKFLSKLIDEIKKRGYQIVTVSELLNLPQQ